MSTEKKYVGSGKKAQNYDLVNITIAEDKVKDHWFEYNGKKYLKLTVAARKETDQYGKTHTVFIDEYKPEAQTSAPSSEEKDDLPF